MKIGIIGSGAIGGVFANKLQSAGYSVTFFSKREDLEIDCILNSFGKIRFERIKNYRVKSSKDYFDIIIIAVKIYDLQATIEEYNSILKNSKYILPIQSYINFDKLDWGGNNHKIYPTSIMFGAFGKPDSLITYFSDGFVCIGNLNSTKYLKILKDVIGTVCQVYITCDISFQMFVKVLVNASLVSFCIESLCSFGLSINTEQKIKKAANVFFEGIELSKRIFSEENCLYPSNLKLKQINTLSDSIEIVRKIINKYYDVIPSIVFDVIRKGPTEMPYIFDDLLDLGIKNDVKMNALIQMKLYANKFINHHNSKKVFHKITSRKRYDNL